MRVAGQILQNLPGAAEWWFGVDNPLDPFSLAAKGFECRRCGQMGHLPVKLKLAFSKRLPQVNQERVPEATAQHPHGKKELFPTTDPTSAVGTDAAARYDTVKVGMQMKVLSPCVKDRKKTNRRAEMFGIGRNCEQGFRHRAEQNAINLAPVLKCQQADLLR